MLRVPKNFFQDPKTFAYADFWAMVPKWALSTLLALTLAILLKKIDVFFAFLLILYPFVALTVDVFLYAFRNRLWKPLPDNVIIPTEWNITACELEQYAKILPKARLMRVLSSLPLIAVLIHTWDFLMALVGFIFFFFVGALFDSSWLTFFKITEPKLFTIKRYPTNRESHFKHTEHDEYDIKYDLSDDTDPTTPGTTAWYVDRDNDSL